MEMNVMLVPTRDLLKMRTLRSKKKKKTLETVTKGNHRSIEQGPDSENHIYSKRGSMLPPGLTCDCGRSCSI